MLIDSIFPKRKVGDCKYHTVSSGTPNIGHEITDFEIAQSQTKNSQDFNQKSSTVPHIQSADFQDFIDSKYLPVLDADCIQSLKETATSSVFIDRLAARMSFFPKFSSTQEVSELALRGVQSTIVEAVFQVLQNMYSQFTFELLANQGADSNASKKPDNLMVVTIRGKKFVLMIGEDKCDLKSDHTKLTSLVRTESAEGYNSLLQYNTEDISMYSVVLYEANKYNFSLFKFNKVIKNESKCEYIMSENLTTPIRLYSKDDKPYDLRMLKDVYYAICCIVSILKHSIDFIKERMNNNTPVLKDVLLLTPQKDSSKLLRKFSIYSETYTFFTMDINKITIYRYNDKFFIVKYIQRKEIVLANKAMSISEITVPTKIGNLEYARRTHPNIQNFSEGILVMKSGTPLNFVEELKNVDEVFERLLQGLSDYHKNNFIHRDIKPSNLVLIKGKLFIIDFGESLQFEYVKDNIAYDFDNNAVDEVVGTTTFLSPEMTMHQPYGPKVDCYSAGVTMLWILAKIARDTKCLESIKCLKISSFFNAHQEFRKYETVISNLIEPDVEKRFTAQQALDILQARTITSTEKSELIRGNHNQISESLLISCVSSSHTLKASAEDKSRRKRENMSETSEEEDVRIVTARRSQKLSFKKRRIISTSDGTSDEKD